MNEAVSARDDVADALSDSPYDVVDTFGDLEPGPPRLVVRVPEAEIDGTAVPDVELAVQVHPNDLLLANASVTAERGELDDEQVAALDDAAEEKIEEPQVTLWTCPADAVAAADVLADLRDYHPEA
ncbi:MAG: hypothetical protein ABEJ68_04800 [Halobacteriaceae archaeon]